MLGYFLDTGGAGFQVERMLARAAQLQLLAGVVIGPSGHVEVCVGTNCAERQCHFLAQVREVAQYDGSFTVFGAVGQDELFDVFETLVVVQRWRAAAVTRLEPAVGWCGRPLSLLLSVLDGQLEQSVHEDEIARLHVAGVQLSGHLEQQHVIGVAALALMVLSTQQQERLVQHEHCHEDYVVLVDVELVHKILPLRSARLSSQQTLDFVQVGQYIDKPLKCCMRITIRLLVRPLIILLVEGEHFDEELYVVMLTARLRQASTTKG